jgi:hypothetical protein
MNRQERLHRIVSRLSHPSIGEMQSYIELHEADFLCLNLQKISYQSVLYYLKRLETEGEVLSLYSSKGHKHRYCLSFGSKVFKNKNKLEPLVAFEEKCGNTYNYSLGSKMIAIRLPAIKILQEIDSNITVVYDSNFFRFYVIDNTLFVAVIEISKMENPRLPGTVYLSGTEYKRCCILLGKHSAKRRTIGVKGRRRITQVNA